MGKVTLNAATIAQAEWRYGKIEIYDEAGNLLAIALPPYIYEALSNPWPTGSGTESHEEELGWVVKTGLDEVLSEDELHRQNRYLHPSADRHPADRGSERE